MSDFKLKDVEGIAHADGAERDISVETTRQINARTQCLIIDYDVPDTVSGRRKRAFFVRSLNRGSGSMTELDDDKIIITSWE